MESTRLRELTHQHLKSCWCVVCFNTREGKGGIFGNSHKTTIYKKLMKKEEENK